MADYRNPPTVVVVVVWVNDGLLMVRRKLADGFGKLALPGGFQVEGETWQQAGAREVLEETGVLIYPDSLTVGDVVTVENGKINLLFAYHPPITTDSPLIPQADEVLEVVTVKKMPARDEIAFETHARHVDIALED